MRGAKVPRRYQDLAGNADLVGADWSWRGRKGTKKAHFRSREGCVLRIGKVGREDFETVELLGAERLVLGPARCGGGPRARRFSCSCNETLARLDRRENARTGER